MQFIMIIYLITTMNNEIITKENKDIKNIKKKKKYLKMIIKKIIRI